MDDLKRKLQQVAKTAKATYNPKVEELRRLWVKKEADDKANQIRKK